jgi:hypothetical protein
MRRLAAAAALAFALLAPMASVSADSLGPTGSYFDLDKTGFCDAGTPCLAVRVTVELIDKVASACVVVSTSDGLGGDVLETGCLESGVAVIFTDKFITGIAPTAFTVDDGAGNTRSVTISASSTATGAPTKHVGTIDLPPVGGCVTTQYYRYLNVVLSGTVTIGSTGIASDGRSFNLNNREKTRCA